MGRKGRPFVRLEMDHIARHTRTRPKPRAKNVEKAREEKPNLHSRICN